MRIQSASSYSNNTNFRAVYPVVHWVAEKNGSYAPVVSMDLTKKLQRKLVTMLNSRPKAQVPEKLSFLEDLKKFFSSWDRSYRMNPIGRSFYDNNGGWDNGKFNPIAYLLTGDDVYTFDTTWGKPLGRLKGKSPVVNGKRKSAELNMANRNYRVKGLEFAKRRAQMFHDKDGKLYGLHTKFEAVRNKKGEIKDFEFRGVSFRPEKGEENPFVQLGYIKE